MQLDKNTIMQIFGSLMKKPSFLSETDKYLLTPNDFSTSFEKYIFSSIYNLYTNGTQRINVVDIDNYLSAYPGIYERFINENGIEYLNDSEEISQESNFNYYYNKLKKFNAVRDLKKQGFDISNIYPDDISDDDYQKKMEKYDSMSVQEIFLAVKNPLLLLESKYNIGSDIETTKAAKGVKDLINQFKTTPDIGINVQGDIFNTVVRGARKGKFYIRSGGTGTGKTRSMVGDACYLAYPIRYNTKKNIWENLGSCEKVLFIATEQEKDEIESLILAYLSGVNEEIIITGDYSEDEEDRINKASEIMSIYEDNFFITEIADPNISSIKSLITRDFLEKDIQYIFYDYIFSSPSLLNEFRDLKIREDVVLMMFSTALKELAKDLNIFIMTATQLSGDYEEKKGIRNQSFLRGAKSIADKADVGAISLKVSEKDLNMLSEITSRYGLKPNQVTDIYKVRRGRYNDIRIWSNVDLGTCRKIDLFVTDSSFNEVENFKTIKFIFDDENIAKYDKVLNLLNFGEVIEEPVISFSNTIEEKNEESSDWDDFD